MKQSYLSRRDMLRIGTTAAGAIAATGIAGCANFTGRDESASTAGAGTSRSTISFPQRKLGALEVSGVGFGAMNTVSGYYGPGIDRAEAIKLIRAAYESGVNFIDTAQIYGPFLSEEYVGEAVQPFRNNVIIATKFGFNLESGNRGGMDSRPDVMIRSVDASLKRLRTDHIDLLYQHRVDPKVPIEDVAGIVQDLIKQGKVRQFGLSQAGEATIRRAHKVQPVAAVQNEYSFWTRDPEIEVLVICEELGICFVPWSPLGMGYLTGKSMTPIEQLDAKTDLRAIAKFPRWTKEAIEANRPIVDLLRAVGARRGATPGQTALAWLLYKKPFIVPIPGTRKLDHMKENVAAINIKLTNSDMQELESGFAKIGVRGKNAPQALLAVHDLGSYLGTSSKWLAGNSPLPKTKQMTL